MTRTRLIFTVPGLLRDEVLTLTTRKEDPLTAAAARWYGRHAQLSTRAELPCEDAKATVMRWPPNGDQYVLAHGTLTVEFL